jgi:hypothetical protein
MEFLKKNIILILVAIAVIVFAALYFMGSGGQALPPDSQNKTSEEGDTGGFGDDTEYYAQLRKAEIQLITQQIKDLDAKIKSNQDTIDKLKRLQYAQPPGMGGGPMMANLMDYRQYETADRNFKQQRQQLIDKKKQLEGI